MVQGTRWCFTLNNYTALDVQLLDTQFQNGGIKYLIYGFESGLSGTPHLQGFVIFEATKTLRSVKRILSERAHFELTRGTSQQASDYCKKEGNYREYGVLPRSAGKRTDLEAFAQWVIGCDRKPTEEEVARQFPVIYLKCGRCMQLVERLYPPATLVQPDAVPRRGWQTRLSSLLEEEPSPRKIIFIVDEEGNSGKTWFCDWWSARYPAETQVLSNGRQLDLFYLIDESKQFFFFDIPRSQSEFLQYPVLEKLKDRRIMSTKYNGRCKILTYLPHVVVFMNESPDRTKLSSDRYHVLRIRNLRVNRVLDFNGGTIEDYDTQFNEHMVYI